MLCFTDAFSHPIAQPRLEISARPQRKISRFLARLLQRGTYPRTYQLAIFFLVLKLIAYVVSRFRFRITSLGRQDYARHLPEYPQNRPQGSQHGR